MLLHRFLRGIVLHLARQTLSYAQGTLLVVVVNGAQARLRGERYSMRHGADFRGIVVFLLHTLR
jgi:hypothetical protein